MRILRERNMSGLSNGPEKYKAGEVVRVRKTDPENFKISEIFIKNHRKHQNSLKNEVFPFNCG